MTSRSMLKPSAVSVWVTDHESTQVSWGSLGPGMVVATAHNGDGRPVATRQRHHPGGAGALTVTGLPSSAQLTIEVEHCGDHWRFPVRTAEAPPGNLLARFATINDLHLGAERFGLLKTMVDTSDDPVPHPRRCADAALVEALAWGARFVIIKGDAVNHEQPENFNLLGQLVDAVPDLPIMLLPGNHDVDGGGSVIPLTVGRRRVPFLRRVATANLPGLTVVGADTTIPGRGWGTIGRVAGEIVDAVAASEQPAFVAIHHQLQTGRLPHYWPAGIKAPDSTRFLDRLADQPTPVMVSSGHTHRNRTRRHGPIVVSEVASTKDWPGVWAGYSVHEGGISQTIRRIEQPGAATWHEYSRQAVLGIWSKWSPGASEDRSFSHPWPTTPARLRTRRSNASIT